MAEEPTRFRSSGARPRERPPPRVGLPDGGRIETAGLICRIAGALLIVVGSIHLLVTPLFAGFIEHEVPARAWAVIGPPTILNHVVVGVLLLPVGAGAIAAGRALHERWGWRLAWIIGLAAAALPAALVALMTGPNYNAVASRRSWSRWWASRCL